MTWQEDESSIDKAAFFPRHGLIAIDGAIPVHFYFQFAEIVGHARAVGANDLTVALCKKKSAK